MMTKDNNIDPSKIVGAWEYIHYYSYDKDDIDGVNEFEYDVVKGDENWYKIGIQCGRYIYERGYRRYRYQYETLLFN